MRIDVETPGGTAWADLDLVAGAGRCVLVLGHGAGGSVDAPDLLAVRAAALDAGVHVVRVTQPYRVLGRRAPAPAARLDEVWRSVVRQLGARSRLRGLPMIYGGRSSGARVACRCAAAPDAAVAAAAAAPDAGIDARTAGPATAAAGVLALAFPVHPPGRPGVSRMNELVAVPVPLLVVQGQRDAFGQPDPAAFADRDRTLVSISGTHALSADPAALAAAVRTFLEHW